MNRLTQATALLLIACVAIGCGGSSNETETAATDESTEALRSPTPPANPYAGISMAVRDTLRRHKKMHAITRDEYWRDLGGVLSNEYFEVWYPEGNVTVTHGMRVFDDIMPARTKLEQYMGRVPEERVVIRFPKDLKEYNQWTGREWWYYSEIRSDTITFQPIFVLVKRGLSDYAIPHEYYQWAIGRLSNYGAPRWIEEGMASYLADEGHILESQLAEFPVENHAMTPDQVEAALVSEESKKDARIAYYHAHRMVRSLIERFGEDKLKEALLLLGDGRSLDEACQISFGLSYQDLRDETAEFSKKS